MKILYDLLIKVLLCFLIYLNSAAPLHSQIQDKLKLLDEYINIKMERDKVPGLAICLVKDNKIVWAKGYGWANTEKKIPMTMSSVLGVASISKLVTATAIMQLYEQGLIDIHGSINKYLPFKIQHPDFPGHDLTIEQILNHTASISNGPSLWRTFNCLENKMSLEEWTKGYFIPGGKYFNSEGNFERFKPGDGFQYSNAGYGLLSYLVEHVSGKNFNDFCQDNIFEPLGMTNTSFNVTELNENDFATMYSYGYGWDLEKDLIEKDIDRGKIIQSDYFFPLCNYTSPTFAAGGLYTSAEQLSKFLISIMNGGIFNGHQILSKESIKRMFSQDVPSSFLPPQFAAYGLGGYAMKLSNGEPVWGHTGADPGLSTFMLFNPEINLGTIVLANRFVDIRDLIEWLFAEGFAEFNENPKEKINKNWGQYSDKSEKHKVNIVVESNYLPGGSQLYIIGNHRFLGQWIRTGIPMSPQKDGSWLKSFSFPDSTKLEFKITRGSWQSEAVNSDGTIPPNFSYVVEKDTTLNIRIADWKDLFQN
ncbi:MAG: serine hydrolase [Bacteroidota bacterium]